MSDSASGSGVPSTAVDAVLECLRSGWLTMGPRTLAFEASLPSLANWPPALATSSHVGALHLALAGIGIGDGEVIVSDPGGRDAAGAVCLAGARPIACAPSAERPLDVDLVELDAKLNEQTRAVIAVQLAGVNRDIGPLLTLCRSRGLVLIIDMLDGVAPASLAADHWANTCAAVCCALERGGIAVGEGGLVASANHEALARMRLLRSHAMTSGTWDRHRGHADDYDVTDLGFNYRIDEPRAALAHALLERLEEDAAARQNAARLYLKRLADDPLVRPVLRPEDLGPAAPSAMPVLLPSTGVRQAVAKALKGAGAEPVVWPGLGSPGHPGGSSISDRLCGLPVWPGMDAGRVDQIVDVVAGSIATEG